MESINIVDAKKYFSDLLSRANNGERFLIKRRDRPVAILMSPTELDKLEQAMEMMSNLAAALGQVEEVLDQIEAGQLHPAMAAFGLWADDEESETLREEIYEDRQADLERAALDFDP